MENKALLWNKSQLVRNFITAVEKKYKVYQSNGEGADQIEQWLAWARQHADRLDPLKNGLLFENDKLDDC